MNAQNYIQIISQQFRLRVNYIRNYFRSSNRKFPPKVIIYILTIDFMILIIELILLVKIFHDI